MFFITKKNTFAASESQVIFEAVCQPPAYYKTSHRSTFRKILFAFSDLRRIPEFEKNIPNTTVLTVFFDFFDLSV